MDKQAFTALVSLAMQGDRAAYAQLCEHIAKDVLYMCIRYTGDYHAGEDAAQEVLVYLQKNIRRLRQADAFYAWLNRVIIGVCANLMRKNKRTVELDREEFTAEMMEDKLEFLPPEWAEKEETRRIVLSALESLPLRQQQAMYMFYLQDMPVKQIAQVLKIPAGTAKVTLHRARTALKKTIEHDNKINLEEYSLKGTAAIPPMALLLQTDALNLVSEASLGRLRETAAAAAGLTAAGASAAAATGSSTAGGVAAGAAAVNGTATAGAAVVSAATATAASTIVPATALTLAGTAIASIAVSGAILASSAASPPVDVSMSPQSSTLPEYILGGEGGEEPVLIFETPESEVETQSIAIPASLVEESTSSELPAPARFTQIVYGRLCLVAGGEEVEDGGRYGAGFVAVLYRGEREIARTTVEESGDYAIGFRATEGAAYQVRIYPPGSRYCAFASGAEAESLNVGAAEGETSLPTVYLVDTAPPTGSIELHGAEAWSSVVNPATATLVVTDETGVAVRWQIAGGGTVLQGEGTEISLEGLAASPEGIWYELVFTATDAGGNSAEFQRGFWRQLI